MRVNESQGLKLADFRRPEGVPESVDLLAIALIALQDIVGRVDVDPRGHVVEPLPVLVGTLEQEAEVQHRHRLTVVNPSGHRVEVGLGLFILGLHVVRIQCDEVLIVKARDVDGLVPDAHDGADGAAVGKHLEHMVLHALVNGLFAQPAAHNQQQGVVLLWPDLLLRDDRRVHVDCNPVLALLAKELLQCHDDLS